MLHFLKSIAKDVSIICLICQQQNPSKMGHGQESLLQSSIIFLQPSSPPMGKKYLLVIIFSSQDALRLFGPGKEVVVNSLFDIFVSDMENSNPSFQGEGTPFTGTLI